jgi:small subunit ribosomal protein S1
MVETPDTTAPAERSAEATNTPPPPAASEGQASEGASGNTGHAVSAGPADPAPPAAATPEPSAEASASGEASHDDAEGDDEADGPDGPEGPQGPGDAPKKKRRRRRKKGAAAAGPEGPPIEGAPEGEGAAPAAVAREKTDRGDRPDRPERPGKGKPPANQANRDRSAFTPGEEVFGRVTSLLDHAIMIDLAGKALAIFDRGELAADDLVPAVGDRFVAQVFGDGSRGGLVVLTRKPLREEEAKPRVEQAFKDKTLVEALVTGVIKGGLEVYVEGLRGFAPASHVDLRLGADLTHLIGQQLPFYVEQYGKRGRDVVLSRKAMLEEEARKIREGSLAKLTPGKVVKGVVRTVVAWGVFVAIPEADDIEGLVHINELSHDPRARAQDVVKVGETVDVKIIRIDEKGKLWLSRRAAEPDPWEEIRTRFALGTKHTGKVTKLQPFGAFVELEPGLEGLIHTADLSLKRIEHPSDILKEGQDVEVLVAHMDSSAHKIGLHPFVEGLESEPKQQIRPHKSIRVKIVAIETGGLLVRVLGATGRNSRGFIPAGQTGTPRGTDLRKGFPVGSEHEVKVIDIDPRRGEAKLSIKALREDTEKAAYTEYRQALAKEAKFGTFADLLKKS